MDRGRDREGWRWTEGGIGRVEMDRGRDREGGDGQREG